MTEFLVCKFIKDSANIESTEVRTRYGMLASVVGIFCNVLLFSVKLAIGLILSSLAVTADAFNNLSDAASSIISFVGVKMAGRILIDVDPTVEEVIFPDEEERIFTFAREVDLKNVKNLVLHNADRLAGLLYDKGHPQLVTFIPSNNYLEDLKYEIRQLVSISRNAEYIKEIEVISPYVKCVNGIIYTSDMKTIIASTMYQTDVVIPEGVENIGHEAFVDCHLTAIKLPDSLKNIEKEAFKNCKNLRRVEFGTGVTEIPNSTFEHCVNLKKVILPSSLEKICNDAFRNTNLSSIKLTEGLKEIKYRAIHDTPKQEIVNPSILQHFNITNRLLLPAAVSTSRGVQLPAM